MNSFTAFLRARGLAPLTWDEALRRVEATPGLDAADFARRHRAFVAYPAAHTARAFYDLVAAHGLHDVLAGHRFDRLAALGDAVEALSGEGVITPGPRVLDVGAGGGHLAAWLRDARGVRVAALDLSPATAAALAAAGFPAPRDDETFDLILCADSLGEVNADEDEWLADPANADDPGYADELEARYGFAAKIEPLRARLAPDGAIVVFEPAPQPHFWAGAARALSGAGWEPSLRADPVPHLVLRRPS